MSTFFLSLLCLTSGLASPVTEHPSITSSFLIRPSATVPTAVLPHVVQAREETPTTPALPPDFLNWLGQAVVAPRCATDPPSCVVRSQDFSLDGGAQALLDLSKGYFSAQKRWASVQLPHLLPAVTSVVVSFVTNPGPTVFSTKVVTLTPESVQASDSDNPDSTPSDVAVIFRASWTGTCDDTSIQLSLADFREAFTVIWNTCNQDGKLRGGNVVRKQCVEFTVEITSCGQEPT